MLIVVAILAVLLGFGLPNFLQMGKRSRLSKARGDIAALKTAIESYSAHNNHTYPSNITSDLTGATPQILKESLADPFTESYYNYALTDSNSNYAVWSKGPNKAREWSWSGSPGADRSLSLNGGDDIVESNVPII